MGCGCGQPVVTSGGAVQGSNIPQAGAAMAEPGFHVEGHGEEVSHEQAPARKIGGVLVSAAGSPDSVWTARPFDVLPMLEALPVAAVPPVVIPRCDKPDQEKIVAAAKDRNKEAHRKNVTLTQIKRTKDAMCFTCHAYSKSGKRCLLSPDHHEDHQPATDIFEPTHGLEEPIVFHERSLVRWIIENGAPCPLDRFPANDDEDQVVRWAPWFFPFRMRWYGVPEPLRWAVTVKRWKGETLDKCGCNVALKRLSQRRGFGWVGTLLEGVQKLRKDMTAKKVFSAGPTRIRPRVWWYTRRRAWPYVKYRIRTAIARRLSLLAKRITRTSRPATR